MLVFYALLACQVVNLSRMAQWTRSNTPWWPSGAYLPMQQHPHYARAMAACGAGHFWLRFENLGSALVILRYGPLLGRVAMVARGPVFRPSTDDAQQAELTRMLATDLHRQFRIVMLAPEQCQPNLGWLQVMTPCHVPQLDLRPRPDVLRSALCGKWRNGLKRGEAACLHISREAIPEVEHWLFRAEATQARQKRYKRLPAKFTCDWPEGDLLVARRKPDAEPLAAMLFLRHGQGASYHIGWSGPEGRRLEAHRVLMWQAIRHFHAEGLTRLELDVIDTRLQPGLARFKLGTGAVPVELGASYLSAPFTQLFA